MEVARALSFQKPGLSESCLSFWILSRRLSTSKKPPYPGNAGPHIIQFFDCHGAKVKEVYRLLFIVEQSLRLKTISNFKNLWPEKDLPILEIQSWPDHLTKQAK